MSNDDYISIVSTFTAMFDLQFNCSACNKKYPKVPARLKEHQARLGCDGKVNPNLVYLPNHSMKGSPKVVYAKCIGNFFNFKAMELVKYLGMYDKNLFPYPGTYYEQPNKFVEAMELVQNLYIENQTEKEQKLKRYKR